MGLGQMTSCLIIHTYLHKPKNKLVSVELEHFLSQPHFKGSVGSPLTFPKMGLGSPPCRNPTLG
jgi:hypothetical protein